MPQYEYKCLNDHYHTEDRSILEDQRVDRCLICNEILKQIYNPPLITLKGKGFYKNSK